MPLKLLSIAQIELKGNDVVAFAQAQFSNDAASLSDGRWQWSAWLSPQGRVRAFFQLLRDDAQNLRLLLRGGDARAVCEALKRFVLRSNVDIRVADDVQVYGIDDASDLAGLGSLPSGDLIATDGASSAVSLGANRWLLMDKEKTASSADLSSWNLADIRDGIPTLSRELDDAALPQWLGLDRLGAVSVRKGCYPGQEIMSRLHFKGGNKRSLYRLSIDTAAMPNSGAPISSRDDAAHAGLIVMSAAADTTRCEALAILSHASADRALSLEAQPAASIHVIQRFG
jgi:folate-binding protein YgfZ